MNKSVRATVIAGGVLWLAQLVLGVMLWTRLSLPLVQAHMGIGLLFVLVLWAQAILCARAGASRTLVVFTILLGLVVPALGLAQFPMLSGRIPTALRVAHLAAAVLAIGLSGRLSAEVAARSRRQGAGS